MTKLTHLLKVGPLTELDLRGCKTHNLGLPKLGGTTVMNNISAVHFLPFFLMKTYINKPMLNISKKQITEFSQLKKRQKSQFEHTNLKMFLPSDFFYCFWTTEGEKKNPFSITDV